MKHHQGWRTAAGDESQPPPRRSERGVVALELVILLPALLYLLIGMVDFGRYYGAKIAVTHAAREGARAVALNQNGVAAAASAAAPTVVTVSVGGSCPPNAVGNASVTVRSAFSWTPFLAAGLVGLPSSASSTAVMRCGG